MNEQLINNGLSIFVFLFLRLGVFIWNLCDLFVIISFEFKLSVVIV